MSYRDTPARPWQRLTLAAISLVALISIAGCTNKHKHAGANGVDAAAPPMAVPVAALSCQSPPDTTPGRLPDHVWIAVAVCPVTIVQFIPGGVAPSLTPQLPRLLHGDLRPLVAALNRPDAPPAQVCTAELVLLPPFWLVDRDAMAYRPTTPKDPCGKPSAAVTAALEQLR